MKILVIGSGGRESALCRKISQSPKCSKLFCAPGNAGISKYAELVPASKIDGIINFVKENRIDLTVVGPEQPLVDGIVDAFEKEGLRIFGPSAKAARIEGSKIFSKDLMKKYGIPTAYYEQFLDSNKAIIFLKGKKYPVVIKADGLAAGKGVIIAQAQAEAEGAIRSMLDDKQFGEAGKKIIIEEFLEGEEASILCFTDGKTIVPMESSQDHKRILDNDEGPNTGGMGAYSPAPVVTAELLKKVEKEILYPTIRAMEKEESFYKGILYAGLMITKDGPKVLEYNARFGDPETQAVLPRLKTDLIDIMEAIIDGHLDKIKIEWDKKAAVCIVLASGGYPGDYKKGYVIEGLDEAEKLNDVTIFHAGTSLAGCDIVTSGGRVLGVTALGISVKEAIDRAYAAVSKIKFKDMHYRKDIGKKALK
ncbi:MAG: phosphoribosylamine--glycine ligase [Candidatus Saganbacteria bacterium]|nr:phosphoribosylamine--glycine ligase [Candidatus Saganbacteria bacterium]